MSSRLEGKAIIVVGAGTGIGAATVERLTLEGAHVCAADINLVAAQALVERIVSEGGRAIALPIDIADAASVSLAFSEATAKLGGLDGAHINAADLQTIFSDSNALDVDLDVFDRTIDVNLRGHLLCTRAAMPHLLARGSGALVYTSSSAGHAGEAERPAYAMSKSGLNALMRHVARRWGKSGITANCIAPGFVMTPEMIRGGNVPPPLIDRFLAQTPSPRVGNVGDIAAAVAMLLSDEARWINGQVIHVNGGALMP